MAINFNELPVEKPSTGNIIPKGTYETKIEKAEMKQGKDPQKPPYLNLQMEVTDPASKTSMGKLFAIITESTAALPRYQLSRLITALNLPITGEFELKDLTKMVVNKSMLTDICPEEKKDGTAPQKSVVDINAGQIFYPLESEATEEWEFPEPIEATPVVPASQY